MELLLKFLPQAAFGCRLKRDIVRIYPELHGGRQRGQPAGTDRVRRRAGDRAAVGLMLGGLMLNGLMLGGLALGGLMLNGWMVR